MSARLPLADIRFISEFAAYARARGDEGYDYVNCRDCACAQFLQDSGRAKHPIVSGSFGWSDSGSAGWTPFPAGADDALNARPRTFSALADRLEALLADAPVVMVS